MKGAGRSKLAGRPAHCRHSLQIQSRAECAESGGISFNDPWKYGDGGNCAGREVSRSGCRIFPSPFELPRLGHLHDEVVLEPDETMQLAFEDPLLVAMRAEALRPIFGVERGT